MIVGEGVGWVRIWFPKSDFFPLSWVSKETIFQRVKGDGVEGQGEMGVGGSTVTTPSRARPGRTQRGGQPLFLLLEDTSPSITPIRPLGHRARQSVQKLTGKQREAKTCLRRMLDQAVRAWKVRTVHLLSPGDGRDQPEDRDFLTLGMGGPITATYLQTPIGDCTEHKVGTVIKGLSGSSVPDHRAIACPSTWAAPDTGSSPWFRMLMGCISTGSGQREGQHQEQGQP
ncbi:hypothetical protein SAMN00790413_04976 [Deinococcus hopiensis KR-140]|uniref:Uncharacterized protein n=1 Tax=Deinococcus hopiensis KR-140 TaxID=695939 RepID=A0A1W1USE6_9DEIO|nr:hypothetical protein SAMN00790413_04976 [Deinococcus hopiensis KR-140]